MTLKQEQVLIQKDVELESDTSTIQEPLSEDEVFEHYINALEYKNERLEEEIDSPGPDVASSIPKLILRNFLLKLFILDNNLKIRARNITYKILNNNTMMILAAGMIPAIVLPIIFNFGDHLIIPILEGINYAILLIFLIEFILKLYVAPSFRKFFTVWRLLDLFILVVAGLEFTPFLIYGSTYSPLLRLLRLVRAFAVAGRLKNRDATRRRKRSTPEKVCVFNGTNKKRLTSAEEMCDLINGTAREWIDIQHIDFDSPLSNNYLEMIGKIIHVNKTELKKEIAGEVVPGIYTYPDYTLIFMKDLKLVKTDAVNKKPRTTNDGVTILLARSSLITISRKGNNLMDRTCLNNVECVYNNRDNRITTYLYDIFSAKVEDYKAIISEIDKYLDELDIYNDLDHEKFREKYIKDTFRLKKEINEVYYNLKRTRVILDVIINQEPPVIIDIEEADKNNLRNLISTIRSLEENSGGIKENISSIIDWHMTTVSFEVNKIIKVLTLITCLTVIPGLVTGFFGENIEGSMSEFNITLFEVFLIVAYVMSVFILFAYSKGWAK
jgi:Mg2+ and Co2+ transporter CorA